MSDSPFTEDLGLDEGAASRDDTVRRAFHWYYERLGEEQRRVLFQVGTITLTTYEYGELCAVK